MEYTALYRKYRPRTFAQLVGQKHIAVTMINALQQQRVSHAYLFCGPRGTGKTSVAHIMSRAVNCLNPVGGEPCGECAACRRILDGTSLDVLEMDAASHGGVDQIRDLLERVKYAPAQEKYKVYIIDEVHMLTKEAFNALLKTLEEPPAQIIFILATTEPHKVLPTILSRCQRYDFHRVSDGDIASHLGFICAQEGRSADEEALRGIARRCEGGMRDAIGLLDQCMIFTAGQITAATLSEVLGTAAPELVAQAAQAIATGKVELILQTVATLATEGRDLRQFLLQLLEYLRDQILGSLNGTGSQIEQRRALLMLRDLIDADQKMRLASLPRITLEIAFLNAAHLDEVGQTAASTLPQTQVTAPPRAAVPLKQVAVQGNPGLNRIVDNWQEILKAVRKKSAVTAAFLQMGKPASLIENKLELAFIKKFSLHMNKVMEEEHKRLIENVLNQFSELPLEISVIEIND